MKICFSDFLNKYNGYIYETDLEAIPKVGDRINIPAQRYNDYFSGIVKEVTWMIGKNKDSNYVLVELLKDKQ